MASKKTQEKKKVKYLIKEARNRNFLNSFSGDSFLKNPWLYFGEEYRTVHIGVGISCYDSKSEARKAIVRERQLLLKERQSYNEAVMRVKKLRLPKEYTCLKKRFLSEIEKKTNTWAMGKMPVFEIVEVDSDKWEAFCGERGN